MKSKLIHQYQKRIDHKLECFFAKQAPVSGSVDKLHRAMRYSVLNGGKRLRPLLVYGAGNLVNANAKCCDNAAIAVECIHAFSLIHDDLPAMDNDDFRRGKPSCHRKFDEPTAILAGDALQSLGFEVLSKNKDITQITLLAKAIGKDGMALGQAQDIVAQQKKIISPQRLYQMHRLKTGELICASILLGVMCQPKKLDNKLLAKIKLFGRYFGLAFQLLDDVLDNENNIQLLEAQAVFQKAVEVLHFFDKQGLNISLLEDIIAYLLGLTGE